jgi:hypothetical protein
MSISSSSGATIPCSSARKLATTVGLHGCCVLLSSAPELRGDTVSYLLKVFITAICTTPIALCTNCTASTASTASHNVTRVVNNIFPFLIFMVEVHPQPPPSELVCKLCGQANLRLGARPDTYKYIK